MNRSILTVVITAAAVPVILCSLEKPSGPKRSPAHTINREVQIESLNGVKPGDRTTLTGDWNGARTKLLDDGVNLTAYYADDCQGNPLGGDKRGFANAATFEVDLFLDLYKIAKVPGLGFFSSFVYRFGTNLSKTSIGNEFNVAEVYGGQSYRLNELYFRESLFDERFVFKAGRLNTGNDFIASPLYSVFVSNAFQSNPVAIAINTTFSEDPFATWGSFLKFVPYEGLIFKFAVYNNNSEIFANKYHGVNFTFDSTQGVMLITEWGYLVNQSKQSHGMPGNYKIGYYYVTGLVDKYTSGSQRGNYGYYLAVDQMVYRMGDTKSQRSISPFAALLFAPKDRNQFPFFLAAGIVNKGIIPSRKDDSLSLGVAYGAYSSDLRKAQNMAKKSGLFSPYGRNPQTAETVIELNYWLQATKWVAITPDIQYVINPKGFGMIGNALVIGLQLFMEL